METLHSIACFSRALIAAVENERDYLIHTLKDESELTAREFYNSARDGRLVDTAETYYNGLLECICK